MIAADTDIERAPFACPSCAAPLVTVDASTARCALENVSFTKKAGVWGLLAPDRAPHLDAFSADYDRVRQAEGRGSKRSEYYRRLPFEDETGRFTYQWRVRAESYRCFVRHVLEPIERPPMRILDLGAGNGWMSARLARRGHRVFAVDVRTGILDGLGAHVHYDARFTPVQAEFDRLPFGDGIFDLVVFNASLHYAPNYEKTLGEALRVLDPGGRIVLVDSPLYRREASGAKMMRERADTLKATYGVSADPEAAEGYLTMHRLRQLSVRLGISWTLHRPRYGARWELRRAAGRLRHRRESARFVVIEGRTREDVDALLTSLSPHPFRRQVASVLFNPWFESLQRWRTRRSSVETVNGMKLRVPPQVFNPVVFRSGRLLAELVGDGLLPAESSVLDLGTGTGIVGMAAARRGASVVAVDVNPVAVDCARANAEAAGVEMTVRRSDLFEGLGRFDVVLFNPPFFRGRPASPLERAWMSEDVPERFSSRLRSHLRQPGGFALLVLSTDGICGEFVRLLAADGYRVTRIHERRFATETLYVLRIA